MQLYSRQWEDHETKYFYHEHLADYAELKVKGLMSSGELYGYFLMSCCVFEPDPEDDKTQIVDSTTRKVYTRFDQDALWDSDTETCYSPFQLRANFLFMTGVYLEMV